MVPLPYSRGEPTNKNQTIVSAGATTMAKATTKGLTKATAATSNVPTYELNEDGTAMIITVPLDFDATKGEGKKYTLIGKSGGFKPTGFDLDGRSINANIMVGYKG
jgi:hypothetical protein